MTSTLERLEVELLTEAVFRHYGMDYRNYAYPSLRRRLWNAARAEGLDTITALTGKVLHDAAAMERLLLALSVSVTAMFRDPTFYAAFRAKVVPLLRSYPFIRVWHAGCATGEEVYSMAILLEEEGLYDRARLYATDMNEAVLQQARKGIFPAGVMAEYARNYAAAGGRGALEDYYVSGYDYAILRQSLRRNVVFAHHNMVTDGSFNEFNVVVCRNVMIYFDASLQERAHELIFGSLRRFGVLCLGRKEALHGTTHEADYEAIDAVERIYRRAA